MTIVRSYVDCFDSWADVMSNFYVKNPIPEPLYVYAEYDGSGYEGDALVIYSNNGVNWTIETGSHCSCYGLENCWNNNDPEFTCEMVEKMYYDNKSRTTSKFKEWWDSFKAVKKVEQIQ